MYVLIVSFIYNQRKFGKLVKAYNMYAISQNGGKQMKTHVRWKYLAILLTLILLVGCQNKAGTESDAGSTENEASETNENVLEKPVTITIYNEAMGLIDDDLVAEMFKPVTDKYPDVSFELLKNANLDDMVAAGEVPDIITTSNPGLYDRIDLELAGDMSEFLDRQDFDWERINPAIVKDLKQQAEVFDTPDAIYGMPIDYLKFQEEDISGTRGLVMRLLLP